MSAVTLSHLVIVDNFIDATGFPDLQSNFFKYEYGPWKNPGDPVGSEYPRYPNWNFTTSDAGYLKEFHFSGTGADIYGAVYCIFEGNNSRSPLPYTASVDGKETPYPDAVRAQAGYPLVYTVSGLPDTQHVIKFTNLSTSNCGPDTNGVVMPIDYALVKLDSKTKIHKDTDLLLASYDDEFVQYSEGGWAPGTVVQDSLFHDVGDGEYLSMTAMETTTVGSSVSFTFFGNYIGAAGTMNIGKTTGYSPPEWLAQVSLQVSLNGDITTHQYPEPNADPRPFFWEASNLNPLPNGAPHVINITLLSSPQPDGDKFRVTGFAYRPTFGSLEEGNAMIKTWLGNGGEIAKGENADSSSVSVNGSGKTGGPASTSGVTGPSASSDASKESSNLPADSGNGAQSQNWPLTTMTVLLGVCLLGLFIV
jgi:hypothetical protein